MKAVLDTNSLVSALLIPPGPSGQIVLRWYAREFELVVSTDTLTDLDDVLRRRHIRKKYPISESDIENYLNYLRNFAEVAPGLLVLDAVPDDPKDITSSPLRLRLPARISSPATVTCWTSTNFRASTSSRRANS